MLPSGHWEAQGIGSSGHAGWPDKAECPACSGRERRHGKVAQPIRAVDRVWAVPGRRGWLWFAGRRGAESAKQPAVAGNQGDSRCGARAGAGGRELAKELLPTHIVAAGDTLLVQPVELDSPVRLPPDQAVQPDGTIDLGVYGRPIVAGKTLPQIETQIKDIIAAHDKGKPSAVTVRLIGRPTQVFYVLGEVNAPAFPITGRETVLDAIIAAGGVTRRASLGNIVLARPTLPDGCRIVFPVCYRYIMQLGDTTTNYQLQPGDRVFVPSQGLLESIFPKKCQTPAAACSRPQVPCFGGGACARARCPSAAPRWVGHWSRPRRPCLSRRRGTERSGPSNPAG